MPAALTIAGQRFGRLTVLKRVAVKGSRNAMWLCQCDCGHQTIGAASNLGKTKLSCGCFANEVHAEALDRNRRLRKNLHGLSSTPEWGIWSRMKQRCSNPLSPKYQRYGGRGIKVCDAWLNDFERFLSDMGKRPPGSYSIDRKNNDGDYEPNNCRWATSTVQARNRSSNIIVEIGNISLSVIEWCELLNVPRWKAYELVRGRGRKRNLPPKCETIEDAVKLLYRQYRKLA